MKYNLNDVSLIIATFNEGESLLYVLKELKNYSFFEIIIVDNSSTDNTVEIAQQFNIKIIQQKKLGWGNAVIEGFSLAQGKYITYMDGDGSYNPNVIPKMYKLRTDYDFICASRYKHNNKSVDDTFIRAIGNKFFTFITNKIFELKISDSLFFYPLIKKTDYEKIYPQSNNFGLCIEIPYLLSKLGLTYTDLLSLERKRIGGKSKVNALKDGLIILAELIKLKLKN